jgi:hypothetical protein
VLHPTSYTVASCNYVQLDYSSCKYKHQPSILPSSSALEASSRPSLHTSETRPYVYLKLICALADFEARKTPSMQTCILSSLYVSPQHREQQPHQPSRSYVIVADPVVASDHGLPSLSPPVSPPCTTVCSPCPPAILDCSLCVRPNPSILSRELSGPIHLY